MNGRKSGASNFWSVMMVVVCILAVKLILSAYTGWWMSQHQPSSSQPGQPDLAAQIIQQHQSR